MELPFSVGPLPESIVLGQRSTGAKIRFGVNCDAVPASPSLRPRSETLVRVRPIVGFPAGEASSKLDDFELFSNLRNNEDRRSVPQEPEGRGHRSLLAAPGGPGTRSMAPMLMGSAAHSPETSRAAAPTMASRPAMRAAALSLAHLTRPLIARRISRRKERGRVVAAPRVVTPFPGEEAG